MPSGIHINQAVLQKIQDDANREMRRVIWDVRNRMVGQSADLVYTELVRSLRVALGSSMQPNEVALREVAHEIETDELKQ